MEDKTVNLERLLGTGISKIVGSDRTFKVSLL